MIQEWLSAGKVTKEIKIEWLNIFNSSKEFRKRKGKGQRTNGNRK